MAILFYSQSRILLWESVVLIVPPMLLELFICLSTWYICKSTTLKKIYLFKTVTIHIISAGLINAFWLIFIKLYCQVLDLIFKVKTWSSFYNESVYFFLAIGVFLYFISILIHYLVLVIEKNQRVEQEVLKQRLFTSQAELKALKTTVHPHFLFNCLSMIGPLARNSPQKVQKIISQLSDFLLYSLRYGKQELVTVQDEIDHIKNYLDIEGIRLGERLNLEFNLEKKVLKSYILPLTLLPLVENGIKHGIGQCVEGGTLSISIKQISGHLQVKVTNPYEKQAPPVNGEGLGLKNLKQRIEVYYGPTARLITRKEKNIFYVKLLIPQRFEKNHE